MSVNIGYLVGNSALRIDALGWDDVPADADGAGPDARRCCARRWRRARSASRRASTTRPGAFATTGELAELTAEAARARRHLPHARALSRWATASWTRSARRSRSGGAAAGRSTSRTSTTGRRYPGTPEQMIELVEDARAEGLDVTWDTYPYEWASTRLLIMLPPWVQAGGPDALRERLADPAVRERLRAEIAERGRALRRTRTRGTTCGWAASSRRRRPALGGPDARRSDGRHGHGRGRHGLRPAARART